MKSFIVIVVLLFVNILLSQSENTKSNAQTSETGTTSNSENSGSTSELKKEENGEATVKTPEEESLAVVKKLVGYIRFSKYEKAFELLEGDSFTKNLMGKYYAQATQKQKNDMKDALKMYMQNNSFPMGTKYFNKVDITFEKPEIVGNEAIIKSSVLWNNKERIYFGWVVSIDNGQYLACDFIYKDERYSIKSYKEQIGPSIEKNGIDKTIALIKLKAGEGDASKKKAGKGK